LVHVHDQPQQGDGAENDSHRHDLNSAGPMPNIEAQMLACRQRPILVFVQMEWA
jgi:hypothetical protein